MKTRLKAAHNFRLFAKHARWYHWLTLSWCLPGLTILYLAADLWKSLAGRGSSSVEGPPEGPTTVPPS